MLTSANSVDLSRYLLEMSDKRTAELENKPSNSKHKSLSPTLANIFNMLRADSARNQHLRNHLSGSPSPPLSPRVPASPSVSVYHRYHCLIPAAGAVSPRFQSSSSVPVSSVPFKLALCWRSFLIWWRSSGLNSLVPFGLNIQKEVLKRHETSL